MLLPVHDARFVHGVSTPESYRAWHQSTLERIRARGRDVAVHVETRPRSAYVSHNAWVIDCECGAGNAVCLESVEALCCECGAVHTVVVLPVDRRRITELLESRPDLPTRNWFVTETVADLERENRAHGVGI